MKFSGIDDRNEAETLRGCELTIDETECLPLADDVYYCFQLQGLKVFDISGRQLGGIVQILQYPAHDLYVMLYGTAEVMIPAVSEFIKQIDIAAGTMVINPVDGLLPEEK